MRTDPMHPASRPRTTRHFIERASRRHLRRDVFDFVFAYGNEVRACGAEHLTVRDRDLPADVRGTALARRASGWIVVRADDGSLLTCYRRRDALRFVRRKSNPGRVRGVRVRGPHAR